MRFNLLQIYGHTHSLRSFPIIGSHLHGQAFLRRVMGWNQAATKPWVCGQAAIPEPWTDVNVNVCLYVWFEGEGDGSGRKATEFHISVIRKLCISER